MPHRIIPPLNTKGAPRAAPSTGTSGGRPSAGTSEGRRHSPVGSDGELSRMEQGRHVEDVQNDVSGPVKEDLFHRALKGGFEFFQRAPSQPRRQIPEGLENHIRVIFFN